MTLIDVVTREVDLECPEVDTAEAMVGSSKRKRSCRTSSFCLSFLFVAKGSNFLNRPYVEKRFVCAIVIFQN